MVYCELLVLRKLWLDISLLCRHVVFQEHKNSEETGLAVHFTRGVYLNSISSCSLEDVKALLDNAPACVKGSGGLKYFLKSEASEETIRLLPLYLKANPNILCESISRGRRGHANFFVFMLSKLTWLDNNDINEKILYVCKYIFVFLARQWRATNQLLKNRFNHSIAWNVMSFISNPVLRLKDDNKMDALSRFLKIMPEYVKQREDYNMYLHCLIDFLPRSVLPQLDWKKNDGVMMMLQQDSILEML